MLPKNGTWKVIVGAGPAGAGGPALREFDLKNHKPTEWAVNPSKPTRITNDKDLVTVLADNGWQNFVANHVDFEEEHLLYVAWSGGRETLVPVLRETPQGTEVVLQWTRWPGKVKGQYVKLFVIPFHATWRLEIVPPVGENDALRQIELDPTKLKRK